MVGQVGRTCKHNLTKGIDRPIAMYCGHDVVFSREFSV